MPPERRNEERIPRAELGGDCRLQRLAKSREAPEIRVVQPHQAHRRAGRREVERPDVEIRDLLGRKKRESPAAAHHAADVVPLIEVRRGRDCGAEPDARQHGRVEHGEGILARKSRHAVADQSALRGDRRSTRERTVAQHLLRDRRDRQPIAQEVEAAHVFVVEDTAFDFGRRHDGIHRCAVVERAQVLDQSGRRAAAGRDRRPGAHESPQHCRARRGKHLAANRLVVEGGEFADGSERL